MLFILHQFVIPLPPRSLGFTGGQATRRSRFGRVPDNFIMDDVDCSGREGRLEECRHNSRDNCGTSEGAGVVCLTPTTTTTPSTKTTATTTIATTRQKERNPSSLSEKQMGGEKVGWLIMGVLAGWLAGVVLLTLIAHKECSTSSPRNRNSTFKILLLVLLLLLIMSVLGLVLALRKSNDVKWFVWMVVAVDGVLLAICSGLLLGKKQRKSRKDEEREVTQVQCPDERGVANDNFVPEVPSAPPLSNQEMEVAPPMTELVEHLLSSLIEQIKREEAGLECPVCLETANVPIYTCSRQHLICSECRPNVESCPECRNPYDGWERHLNIILM